MKKACVFGYPLEYTAETLVRLQGCAGWIIAGSQSMIKTNKVIYASSEDSDQPGYLPSLIKVFADCMKKTFKNI